MEEEQPKSKLEQIVGDTEAFRIMLDGALSGWNFSYDVLLVDTGEYLFESKKYHPHFRPFCGKLRSKPNGEALCCACDMEFAKKGVENPFDVDRQIYVCHAGLMDIAIPIIVNDEHIATVFCGQVRPSDEKLDQKHFKHVSRLENELGFEQGDLEALAYQTPQRSLEELNDIRQRISHLVNYISDLGHQRLELERAYRVEEKRSELGRVLYWAAHYLTELTTNWDEFWLEVSVVLKEMTKTIGAGCCMVLLPIKSGSAELDLIVKAVAGLPTDAFQNRRYPFSDNVFYEILLESEIVIKPCESAAGSDVLSGSLYQANPDIVRELDAEIFIRISVEPEEDIRGMLVFWVNTIRIFHEYLPLDRIADDLKQLAALIGVAYHNSGLYQTKVRELQIRRKWLQQISHQLTAPIHGVQGYADNLRTWQEQWKEEKPEYFRSWNVIDLERWKNSLDSIVWTSHYAARLTQNLAWAAYRGEEKNKDLTQIGKTKSNFSLIGDMGSLLVRSARDFQGLARQRGLRRLEVDTESAECLNGQLYINEDLFRQALGNVLDNAIKYADRDTYVDVVSGIKDRYGVIRVSNVGIRLRSGDVDKIFDYEYRTEEAQKRYATGTGIGLYVTRQIIELHNGKLTAVPSKQLNRGGWLTTFVIELPLLSKCD